MNKKYAIKARAQKKYKEFVVIASDEERARTYFYKIMFNYKFSSIKEIEIDLYKSDFVQIAPDLFMELKI